MKNEKTYFNNYTHVFTPPPNLIDCRFRQVSCPKKLTKGCVKLFSPDSCFHEPSFRNKRYGILNFCFNFKMAAINQNGGQNVTMVIISAVISPILIIFKWLYYFQVQTWYFIQIWNSIWRPKSKMADKTYKVLWIGYKVVGLWIFSNKMLISIYWNVVIQNGRPEMFWGSYLSRYSTDNETFLSVYNISKVKEFNLIFFSILEFYMAAKIQNGCQKLWSFINWL